MRLRHGKTRTEYDSLKQLKGHELWGRKKKKASGSKIYLQHKINIVCFVLAYHTFLTCYSIIYFISIFYPPWPNPINLPSQAKGQPFDDLDPHTTSSTNIRDLSYYKSYPPRTPHRHQPPISMTLLLIWEHRFSRSATPSAASIEKHTGWSAWRT